MATSTFCIHLNPRSECPNAVCNPQRTPLKQIRDAMDAAKEFVRYYSEPAWADEQERNAKEASDGNVLAIEVIVSRLRTEMDRLALNRGSLPGYEDE